MSGWYVELRGGPYDQFVTISPNRPDAVVIVWKGRRRVFATFDPDCPHINLETAVAYELLLLDTRQHTALYDVGDANPLARRRPARRVEARRGSLQALNRRAA